MAEDAQNDYSSIAADKVFEIGALCQSCHLAYDLQDHIAHARETRMKRRAVGSLFTLEET